MKKQTKRRNMFPLVQLILFYFIVLLFSSCEGWLNFAELNQIDYMYASKSIILGDSITAGNEWDLDSFGVPGATLDWMYYNHPDLTRYDNIYILMGINNLAEGDEITFINSFMIYMKEKFIDKNFYIISVLPIDETQRDFTTNEEIKELNTVLSKISNVINVYDYMLDSESNNPYTTDGLHLTEEGYSILESILYRYVMF